MPATIEAMLTKRRPTAEYPLLGQTILVIEDSRFASEALRLMCLRSGARIRRADSLRAAARHLATYRPSIAVIDLGLPDGSGLSLISEMAAGRPPVTVILATSGDDTNADIALEAGAHGFLPKPVTSIAGFQAAVLDHLPKEAHPKGPRPLTEDIVLPDPLALRDDLAQRQRSCAKAMTRKPWNIWHSFSPDWGEAPGTWCFRRPPRACWWVFQAGRARRGNSPG